MAYVVLVSVEGVFSLKGYGLVFASDLPHIDLSPDGLLWWFKGQTESKWLTGGQVFDPESPECHITQENKRYGVLGVFNTENLDHLEELVEVSSALQKELNRSFIS